MARTERVVILIWDGMRPDFVRPELTPHLCAFAARSARYTRATGVFPTVTLANTASLVTGTYPDRHGIAANIFVGPPGDRAPIDGTRRDDLGRLRRVNAGRVLPCQTLTEAVVSSGKRMVVITSSSAGQATLLDPEGVAITIGPEYMSSDAHRAAVIARCGPLPPKAVYDNAADEWLHDVLIEYILPDLAPDIVLCWLNEPDTSQHAAGLGSPEALAVIRSNDAQLGRVLDAVARDGVRTTVIVASDHGHSTVTGMHQIGDELTAAGFAREVAAGTIRFAKNDLVIEEGLDTDRLRERVGRWLFTRSWVGAVINWGEPIPGMLAPAQVWSDDRPSALAFTPTFSYSYIWGEETNAFGIAGTEETFAYGGQEDYDQLQGPVRGLNRLRSTHGTLSPFDLRTTLVLGGAGVRDGVTLDMPAGVIDLAPTALALLGLPPLPRADGRVLDEAFVDGPMPATISMRSEHLADLRGGPLYRHWIGTTAYLDTGRGNN